MIESDTLTRKHGTNELMHQVFRLDRCGYVCNPVSNINVTSLMGYLGELLEEDSETDIFFKLKVDRMSQKAISIINLIYETPGDYFEYLESINKKRPETIYSKRNLISYYTKQKNWKKSETIKALEEIKKMCT